MSERNTDQASILLQELFSKYGGLDNIPAEELATLGYARVGSRIAKVSALESEARGREAKERADAEAWEAKKEHEPFGEIQVVLPLRPIMQKVLTETELTKLRALTDECDFDSWSAVEENLSDLDEIGPVLDQINEHAYSLPQYRGTVRIIWQKDADAKNLDE